MEAQKISKNLYALPQDNYQNILHSKYQTFKHHPDSMEAPFMKYASSIIEVISEDNIGAQSKTQIQFTSKQPIYDISEVKVFQMPENASQNASQIDYNQIAARMKKKPTVNTQILAYNFSNITLFYENLDKIFKKNIHDAFKIVTVFVDQKKTNQKTHKTTPKKSSCHSGYTTSTNHDQNIFKKQKKRQNMKEGANQIKGWIQFKFLIILNESFKQILQRSLLVRQQYEVKENINIKEVPLEDLQQSQLFKSKNMLGQNHHIEESFIYTVQHISDFGGDKQLSITTPDKFHKKFQHYPSSLQIKNRSKQPLLSKPPKSKNNIYFDKIIEQKPLKIEINHPIQIQNHNNKADRRYLILRTNCYQLPLLSEFEDKTSFYQKNMEKKINSLNHDTFHKNNAQIISELSSHFKAEFQKAKQLLVASSQRATSDQHTHQKVGLMSYTKEHNSKTQKVKTTDTKKLIQAPSSIDTKKLNQASSYIDMKKIQNYYFPLDKYSFNSSNTKTKQYLQKQSQNQYNFVSKQPFHKTIQSKNPYLQQQKPSYRQKNNFDEIKSIQSIIDVVNQELIQKQNTVVDKNLTPYEGNHKIKVEDGYYHHNSQKNLSNQLKINRQQFKVDRHSIKKQQIKPQNIDRPYSPAQNNHNYNHSKDKHYYATTNNHHPITNNYQSYPSTHQYSINQPNHPLKNYTNQNHNQQSNQQPNSNYNTYELSKKIDHKGKQKQKIIQKQDGSYHDNLYQVVSQKNIKSNYGLFLEKNNINSPILSSIRKNSASKNANYLVQRPAKSPETRVTSPQPSYLVPKDKQVKIIPNKINPKHINFPPQPTRKQQSLKDKFIYFSPQNKKQLYPHAHPHQIQKPQRIISKLLPYQQRPSSKLQYTQRPSQISHQQQYYNYQRPQRINSKIQQQTYQHYHHQSPQNYQHKNNIQNNYFMKTDRHRPEIKAINYNNNYYTSTTIKNQPIYHQQQLQYNNHISINPIQHQIDKPRSKLIVTEMINNRPTNRPPSCRDSIQRINPFNHYSQLDSELSQHKKSHSSSRHTSQLSRPKSMNSKIQMTLRRQR